MSGTTGMRIKVKTEELKAISTEVEDQIRAMRQCFDRVREIVERSSSYWEGEGQTSYIQAYRRKHEGIETALRRFSSNVTNLRMIAGVYESTEAAAKEMEESLLEDVIV